eukprot:TRINITY_DN37927_c0_g1_i1.p1 TRINITY_DN37927_c0_g1~~TRINITY_DN37927_c0_g1_i1.p1  ORF type:complete len:168 (-),score=26.17 TRINITY_DN37927_c0_g1_i1:237-740(-)
MGSGGKGKGRSKGSFARRQADSRARPTIAKKGYGKGKGSSKGRGKGPGKAGPPRRGPSNMPARSRIPEGHTIILVQYSDRASSKTYSEHSGVTSAMDAFCQMYEQVLKSEMGNQAQAKYTVEDLWSFIDSLSDLVCLVYRTQTSEYKPHNREWIKEQVLKHLKGQLS